MSATVAPRLRREAFKLRLVVKGRILQFVLTSSKFDRKKIKSESNGDIRKWQCSTRIPGGERSGRRGHRGVGRRPRRVGLVDWSRLRGCEQWPAGLRTLRGARFRRRRGWRPRRGGPRRPSARAALGKAGRRSVGRRNRRSARLCKMKLDTPRLKKASAKLGAKSLEYSSGRSGVTPDSLALEKTNLGTQSIRFRRSASRTLSPLHDPIISRCVLVLHPAAACRHLGQGRRAAQATSRARTTPDCLADGFRGRRRHP